MYSLADLFFVEQELPVEGVDGGMGEGREGWRHDAPLPRRRRQDGGAEGGAGETRGAGHAPGGAPPTT